MRNLGDIKPQFMQARRKFLKRFVVATAGFSMLGSHRLHAAEVSNAAKSLNDLPEEAASQDEDLWGQIRLAYPLDRSFIYLNSGGVSPHPKVVQDSLERFHSLANSGPSYFMGRGMRKELNFVLKQLAKVAGCSVDEICINRNTTEALDTVILGLNLKSGDEVILARQDYPNMVHAWKQRELRDGVKLVWIDLPMPSSDESELVDLYVNAFTSKTKAVHITHINNWTGQMMPVKQICAKARQKNIQSVVDGAHSFAHVDFRIDDLNCDYFGTSLHKWLGAPFGTGMLYVRKERIADLWPLFPSDPSISDSITKFKGQGTHSLPIELAIGDAIAFHEMIGISRKEARLRYLKNYLISKMEHHPKVSLLTPKDPQFSAGIVSFDFEGIDQKGMDTLARSMLVEHSVFVSQVKWANLKGIRISPNVFTTLKELDRCSEGLLALIDA